MKGVGHALLALWLATGCTNHVRFLDVQREERGSEILSSTYRIDGPDQILREPELTLRVARVQVFEDRRTRTTVMFEEFTPYRGVQEVYEVPAGLLFLPLALVTNFVLLGYEDYLSWSLAAANPFLNAEDPRRVEQRELHTIDAKTDLEERRVRTPLGGLPVAVQLGEGEPLHVRTDASGELRLHLLDLVGSGSDLRPRKLLLRLEGEAGLHRELLLDRDLARSIGRARRHVLALQGGSATVESLAEAVYGLDRLGFEAYSLRVEERIATRYREDAAFLVQFNDVLDGLYGRGGDEGPHEVSARRGLPASGGPAGPISD